MTGPLLLLDSASMYFRAFYGVPDSVVAPDGQPVNAVRGFTDMVSRLITERRPSRLVACLDLDWRPVFRVQAIPSYKTHRVAPGELVSSDGELVGGAGPAEAVPDGLGHQVPVILDVLAAAGIATGGAAGYEADDVIGTLCARERSQPVEVVSGDRDLLQLVRDEPNPVRVIYIGRGLAKAETFGPVELAAKYRVPAERAGDAYAEMAMLRGDPSDGLPGVPGVGEKTAAALVTKYGTLDAILDATPKVAAHREYVEAAKTVVCVATDVPVPDLDDRLCATPRDPARLVALSDRWGLDGPLNRLLAALDRACATT